jgi:hypothetical protein
MRARRILLLAGVLVAILSPRLSAITGGDVLTKMTEKEQFGYITGAIDTMLYLEQAGAGGSTPRSRCILDWFCGKNSRAAGQIIATFNNYQDKPAIGLIKLLADRACGK